MCCRCERKVRPENITDCMVMMMMMMMMMIMMMMMMMMTTCVL